MEARWSPIHAAAHKGAAPQLEALLHAASEADSCALTADGDSAAHLAALGANAECLRLLLPRLAPRLNHANRGGWTPLALATLARAPLPHRLASIELLLASRADAELASSRGWTPLLLAAHLASAPVLAALLRHHAGERATLRRMLGARTSDGDSALLLAAHEGSLECTRLLLAAGASVDVRNGAGLGAVQLAVGAACTEAEQEVPAEASDAATATCGAGRTAGGAPPPRVHTSRRSVVRPPLLRRGVLRLADGAVIELLIAAGAPLHPVGRPAGGADAESPDANRWALLHLLAAAPPHIPLRRLISLACILRRAGVSDEDGTAASVAAASNRPALQAAMGAAPPAPIVLLCAQRPVEEELPEVLAVCASPRLFRPASNPRRQTRSLATPAQAFVVCEGALQHAELETEPGSVVQSMLSRHEQPGGGSASLPAEVATEIRQLRLAATAEAAVERLGGTIRKRRLFRRIDQLLPDADGSAPNSARLAACIEKALATRCLLPFEPLADACARALDTKPSAAAEKHSDGQLEGPRVYQQRQRRMADGAGCGAELLELTTQPGAAVVRDVHMQMLREVLGDDVVLDMEETESASARAWSVYFEHVGASAADCTAWLRSGNAGLVNLYSVDAPLLLSWSCGPVPAHDQEARSDSEDSLRHDSEDDGLLMDSLMSIVDLDSK
ncbi:hypothetical protein AB1Y20_016026 [Prymnesium parvum]|uniref:Uncharacterized protein n=1 Tax=Prymnesium parvum TaxID=97485 RepID=A0AB34K344_PRYPA